MTALVEHRRAVLSRAGRRCELVRLVDGHECGGRLQAMHLLPKAKIRDEQSKAHFRCRRNGTMSAAEERLIETPLDVIVADSRNGMAGCIDGHRDHDLYRMTRTGRSLRITRAQLPDRVFDFAEEYALDLLLDREFPNDENGGSAMSGFHDPGVPDECRDAWRIVPGPPPVMLEPDEATVYEPASAGREGTARDWEAIARKLAEWNVLDDDREGFTEDEVIEIARNAVREDGQ